ncbi:uncharacterized protein [Drosophila virilis]|uniref:uncharacterized protein n=1 Tax=Drosophila virilis TaxID=7244 RepID=UPI0038B3847F
MVQCVKRVLRHTVKEVAPKLHVLIEAENVVNTRPLTHLPVSVDHEAPLTPNDLLNGVANLPDTPDIHQQPNERCVTRKLWRMAQLLRNRFWKRWVLEYLPTFVQRVKRVEPIRHGDAVFICDPAVQRREWLRGIVE